MTGCDFIDRGSEFSNLLTSKIWLIIIYNTITTNIITYTGKKL